MAALTQDDPEETRRTVPSPRPKGRESAKDTLCRNVTIYGHCRYEDKGCAFNHDPVKPAAPQNQADSVKKRLNVDSPSFTPASLAVNGSHLPTKAKGLSPKAANAAPFKPKGLTSAVVAPSSSASIKQYNPKALDWVAPELQEFLPQTYNSLATPISRGHFTLPGASLEDPFFLSDSLWKALAQGLGTSKASPARSAVPTVNHVLLEHWRISKGPNTKRMSTPHKGPNPGAGVFIPNGTSSPGLLSSFSMNPQTPLPVGQDLQSTSSSPQVKWSSGDAKGNRGALARHVYSLSEPNRDMLSHGLDSFNPSNGSHTSYSSPRRLAQRSMPDDPRSLGSPLKPAQYEGTKTPKSLHTHSAVRHGNRAKASTDMGSEGCRTMAHRQISEPNQRPRVRSAGSTNYNDNPIPLYVPGVANRLGCDGGLPAGFQHQLSHTALAPQYPHMYNQTRPLYMHGPSLAPSMSFQDNNPFSQSSAHVFPSHSFSSNQPFHKAQESFQIENNDDISQSNFFEPYAPATPTPNHATPQPQVNPYTQDANGLAGPAYYQGSNSYTQQQIQYHLYAALGPHRELQPNQRTARDLFIPENLRQSLQQQTEATMMVMQNSTLPPTIGPYHTLVPLTDNPNNKDKTLFGYKSWLYKAVSNTDGKTYCLRRIQDYRLTSNKEAEAAIRSVQHNWKRVKNGNVVSVFLSFTNPGFGDSSLIFVTDYHPRSETLAQKHITPVSRFSHRNTNAHIPEQLLWGYVVQVANALKAIHSAGLAARVIDPGKVILTGENRIRLNACAIMDVIQHDALGTIADLQRRDLWQFGQLILMLGTNSPAHSTSKPKQSLEQFSRFYSLHLQESVSWLLDHGHTERTDGIDVFLSTIASDVVNVFDASLHLNDELTTDLNRELENSRLVRLLTKLNFINNRPEYEQDQRWSEHGNRLYLGLFRDYVFHQVDAHGNPVLDLGHVLACLNKLDTGSEEKITLVTRDEMTVLVVSYRELKGCVEGAWQELVRRAAV